MTPTGQRDVSYHRTSCSLYTWLRESPRRGADCSLGMDLASVSECWAMWIACSSWVFISLFITIFIVFYFVSVVLFSSQPTSFTFFFPDYPRRIHWGEEEVGEQQVVFGCCLGLNHNNWLFHQAGRDCQILTSLWKIQSCFDDSSGKYSNYCQLILSQNIKLWKIKAKGNRV